MLKTPEALEQLMGRWLAHFEQSGQGWPTLEYDKAWTSDCQLKDSLNDGFIGWSPVKNEQPGDFSNIEQALECELHQDVKDYYTGYWSADLEVEHEKGPMSLLQIFNQEDFDILQQNIIGYVMMKRLLKQRVTIFFAVTDQDDQMISLLNDSGEIWLEYVGQEPHLKLADTMAEFLSLLKIPG